MACEGWQSKIDTYLDGELPADEMRAFDAHVRNCAECAPLALARVQMKQAVRTAGTEFVPSAEFRRRIQQTVSSRKPKKKFWTLAWAAVALLLLFGVLTVYRGQQGARSEHLYSELADQHVATLASANPVDVVSTDRHTVKPWFQGKLPFTFNLPDLQNTDFTLLGGRVTYLAQNPGAHLIYRIRKHEISVFIFQARTADVLAGSSSLRTRDNFHVRSWREGDLVYFVIGDVGAEDIKHLSDLLQSAAKF